MEVKPTNQDPTPLLAGYSIVSLSYRNVQLCSSTCSLRNNHEAKGFYNAKWMKLFANFDKRQSPRIVLEKQCSERSQTHPHFYNGGMIKGSLSQGEIATKER